MYRNKLMRGVESTKEDIGKFAVVKDNSWIIDILTQEDKELAGKVVRITSAPFQQIVKGPRSNSRPHYKDCVLVVYRGRIYRVINGFKYVGSWKDSLSSLR